MWSVLTSQYVLRDPVYLISINVYFNLDNTTDTTLHAGIEYFSWWKIVFPSLIFAFIQAYGDHSNIGLA
jgi:hypothetical protein